MQYIFILSVVLYAASQHLHSPRNRICTIIIRQRQHSNEIIPYIKKTDTALPTRAIESTLIDPSGLLLHLRGGTSAVPHGSRRSGPVVAP